MHDFQTDSVLPTINVENEESAIVSGSLMAADTDPAPQIFHEQSIVPRGKRKGRQKPANTNLPNKRLLYESFEIDTKTSSKNNQHISHQTNQQQQSDGIQSCLAEDSIQVQDGHTQKRLKKKQSIPSFLDLCCLIPSDQKAIEYLASHGIFTLPKDTICTHCGYKGLRHKEKNRFKSLKCNRCNKGQSIVRGTFFEHTKASMRTILHLAAHWLHKMPRADTINQLKCSSATVTEFHRSFRKMVKQSMGEDLRVIALTADKNSMSQEIPKGARRNELDEHYCVVLWREVNRENLWEAFLAALRSYTLSDSSIRGGSVSVELNNQVWVDGEKGTACCKYHLKQHLKEMND
ncbi:hypothetical protein HJC23_002199 [Cyclotella cryptica]|uniref:Transposase n=1 Tax=Cyclotella cryptica TaxID=29204 RepID=A0ABD3Q6Y9_9STRA